MRRATLALLGIALCCGCQGPARSTNDPFWGRTRVPPPATGAAGGAGDPYYNRQPVAPGLQPVTPGAATPSGVPPISGGATYNYPNSYPSAGYPNAATPVAAPTPPAGYGRTTMSGYPNVGATNAMPVSTSPAAPASSGATSPSSWNPPTSPATIPAPVPASSPSGNGAPPGYLPPNGMNYQGSNGAQSPAGAQGGNWNVPGRSDPYVTPASAAEPPSDGLGTVPSVIRIPAAASAGDAGTMPVTVEATESIPASSKPADQPGNGANGFIPGYGGS